MKVGPQTTVGPVHLIVKNGKAVSAYYQDIVGLKILDQAAGRITLGVAETPLVILHLDREAEIPSSPQPGLFHQAFLVPTRRDLAVVLRHLIDIGEPLGASDHGASEALYLNDPEGNGIEIYADRPRASWPVDPQTGRLAIYTRRLNGQDLLGEIGPSDKWDGLPKGTSMGHVHLRVADIPKTKAFYIDLLGFDFMQDYGNSAVFVSVNGYHHHLGMNTWETRGMVPTTTKLTGLNYFEIHIPNSKDVTSLAANLAQKGFSVETLPDGYLISDPDGINIYFKGS